MIDKDAIRELLKASGFFNRGVEKARPENPWERRVSNSEKVDAMVQLAFDKASFGGDRSAAGRYAAEQRWKGHVRQGNRSKASGSFGSVLELKAAKQRYGASPKDIVQFFRDKHSFGLKVQDFRDEDSATQQSLYGTVQAWDDLLSNGYKFPPNIRNVTILTYATSDDGAVEIYGNGQAGMFISAPAIATSASRIFNGELPKGYSASADFASKDNPSVEVLTQRLGYAATMHEFAHALDVNASRKEAKMGRYWLSSRLDGESSGRSGFDRERIAAELKATAISGYGATDRQEFVAEAFTAWILGDKRAEKLVRPWLDLLPTDILKASFGGDRSAAGRYAAEQRWKGNVKQDSKIADADRLAGNSVLIQRKWGIDKMPALKNVSTEALLRLVNSGVITAGVPYTSIDSDLSDPFLGSTNDLKSEETPQNDRTAIVHHLAAGIIRNWESSASRTSALLAKMVAKDAFGLTDTVPLGITEELTKEDAETLGAVVKAMYERTQQHLEQTGLSKNSEVTLYRATVLPFRVKVNEVVDYQTAPLTSFTTEQKIANDFAKNSGGSVVKAIIASSQIFFINNVMMTGGWMGEEKEVIVLGGKLETTVVSAQPLRRQG